MKQMIFAVPQFGLRHDLGYFAGKRIFCMRPDDVGSFLFKYIDRFYRGIDRCNN